MDQLITWLMKQSVNNRFINCSINHVTNYVFKSLIDALNNSLIIYTACCMVVYSCFLTGTQEGH